MNPQNLPVFTRFNDCQDCYKCVRECPVKAIKIENYHASIISELCIHCGHCVKICPVEAKRIRDDLSRVRLWLEEGRELYVSLAPSWKTEFPDLTDSQMIQKLTGCGFKAVSETALGAEEVNSRTIEILKTHPSLCISSACPVVTSLLAKKYGHLCKYILPLESPLLSHCRMLKNRIPQNADIVFIGPCIAKKVEADSNPSLLKASITFLDLEKLFKEKEEIISNVQHEYFPFNASEGKLYPIDGGMSAGIRNNPEMLNRNIITITGIDNIIKALEDFDAESLEEPLFIELMACEGGCINGPGKIRKVSYLQKRMELINKNTRHIHLTSRLPESDIEKRYVKSTNNESKPSESEISEVFHSIGKIKQKDQLNCGSCGYNSCRDFAVAVLEGKAEPGMCVSYLRKRAQKKANALFNRMPTGAVIVNESLEIVEANAMFFSVLGLDDYYFDEDQRFAGAILSRLIPFSNMFERVLKTGNDIIDKEISYKNTIMKVSIFSIEPHITVCGIIQDVTEPSVMREQTIAKARQVITNNLNMVQKVAYLLGENAAELESTLNSVIDVTEYQKDNPKNRELINAES